eukprot:5262745-Alexandrium_andersonii.AAC.1
MDGQGARSQGLNASTDELGGGPSISCCRLRGLASPRSGRIGQLVPGLPTVAIDVEATETPDRLAESSEADTST